MKLHVSAAALAGFVLAALSVSGTTQTAPAAVGATEALTVTGCLRENPMRPGAYALDSIEGGGAEKSYRLIGSATADLKAHVGHKVKVTGTVAKAAVGASGTASATAGATAGGIGDGPAMNVTVVGLVADTCSAPSR